MSKFIITLLKPLSFLPAVFMMCLIFSFSAQTGVDSGNLSHKISYAIVDIGNNLLQKDLSEERIEYYADRLEYPVRKLAHMTEYFVLAICISLPLYVYGLRGFPLMLVAGLLCVGFAASDEYHQSFVAGRGPSVRDVGIDSIGAFAGIITVRIVCWIFLTPARLLAKRREKLRRRQELLEKRQRIEARKRREAQRQHRKYHESRVSQLTTTILQSDIERLYEEFPGLLEDDREAVLAAEIQKYMEK